MDRTASYEYAGFWRRVAAALLDSAIGFALFPLSHFIMLWSFQHKTVLPELVYSLVWHIVFLYLVIVFGGTPGKLLMRIRIVNLSGEFLSLSAAIKRISPYLLVGIVGSFQIYNAVNNHPGFDGHPSFMQLWEALDEYGGISPALLIASSLFIYVDIGAILFNNKKRAIHDFLAGSFVITKTSFLRLNESARS